MASGRTAIGGVRPASSRTTHRKALPPLGSLFPDPLYTGNCEPRKKAGLREVKKDTPNKGRFFWACPGYPYCDLFLWRDEALVREAGPLPDSAEELPPPPKTPTFTQRPLTSFGVQISPGRSGSAPADEDAGARSSGSQTTLQASPLATTGTAGATTPCPTPSKRSRDDFEPEGDDFSDFGSDEERQLAEIADSSAGKSSCSVDAFANPKSGPAAAPGTTLPPSPSVARTLFPGTDRKRQKTVSFDDAQPTGLPTPIKSPTASRLGDPSIPSSSPLGADLDTVVDDVVALLKDQPIESAVLSSVTELLSASVRKTRCIATGTEAARAALKQKDDRIAELQERVAALENRGKSQRTQLTSIKAQLMKMYQDN